MGIMQDQNGDGGRKGLQKRNLGICDSGRRKRGAEGREERGELERRGGEWTARGSATHGRRTMGEERRTTERDQHPSPVLAEEPEPPETQPAGQTGLQKRESSIHPRLGLFADRSDHSPASNAYQAHAPSMAPHGSRTELIRLQRSSAFTTERQW